MHWRRGFRTIGASSYAIRNASYIPNIPLATLSSWNRQRAQSRKFSTEDVHKQLLADNELCQKWGKSSRGWSSPYLRGGREKYIIFSVVTGTHYGTKTPPDQQPTKLSQGYDAYLRGATHGDCIALVAFSGIV